MGFDEGPIGVFDSGVGGLTVLKAIRRLLPYAPILYFGDTARVPYGTRSRQEIIQFVQEIVGWMSQERVRLVVMACNTSSALALPEVSTDFEVPLLGMIEPAACAAAGGQRIGVIATPATAASHAYRRAITTLNPAAQVWEVGCPAFVPLIEQNRIYTPETRATAQAYLAPLLEQGIDTLVYGCTHYPLLDPVIKDLLPATVRRINPAAQVAIAVAQQLPARFAGPSGSAILPRFCVSDGPEQFAQLASQWLGYVPEVERVVPSLCGARPLA
ncbi:MAG: glutamate racemase [Cyanobacteria bacterium P01_A01_bin.135]